MLTPIPLSGPLVEDQNPTTPIRSISLGGDFNESMMAYGGASAGQGHAGLNQFRSPLHWPLPTSPIHTYAGLGGSRTPARSFDNTMTGEGRLSMSQFEFGADGELVLYSAGGQTIQPTSGKKARHSNIRDALESVPLQFGLGGMDANDFEQKMHSLSRKIANNAASVHVPADHIDNFTPGDATENGMLKAVSQTVKQKTLTDGGRCRSKSMKADTLAKTLARQKEDMVSAPPERRFQKIQSLYVELQKLQELGHHLQSSIRQRDGQIVAQEKDNASLWSMAAHVGTAIQMALDEESHAVRKTPVRQKRRRSSVGAEENPAKCQRTPNVTRVGAKQLLELEELFNSPRTGDIFACDIFMSPLGYGNVAMNNGMCPITTPLQHKTTFSSLMSPMPLGSFNEPAVSFAVDNQTERKASGDGKIDKENSFSFHKI